LVIAGATLALRFVEALWLVLPSASAVPRANFRKIPKTFFTCVSLGNRGESATVALMLS